MSKKGLLVAFFVLIVVLKFVAAQETDNADKIDKAFQCLEDEIRKTQTLTLQQATFSMLVGSGGSRVTTAVQNAKKPNENCWPKEGCRVKETAQVAMAYKKQNKNSDAIIVWLENQTSIPKELSWYLQIVIEENKPASCIVGYDGLEYTAEIGSDGYTINAPNGLGNCLSLQPTTYWMAISASCAEKIYSVSCSKSTEDFSGFKTAFLYKDNAGETTYVSQTTTSRKSGERSLAQISVKCFKKEPGATGCDYESSLWATTALDYNGKEIKDYIVYLKALYNNAGNQKFFPESFLIHLTGRQNEFFARVIDKRINAKWDIPGSPYSSFYDTALGIMALGGKDNAEASSTVAYLFEPGVQTTQGCWNNNDLTDTAFLLYTMGAGRRTTAPPDGGSPIGFPDQNETNVTDGSDGGVPPILETTQCEDAGLYCAPSSVDCLVAGGFVEDQYNCAVHTSKCCTVSVSEEISCTEKGGKICKTEEKCSVATESTSDGACCLGVCQVQGEEDENDPIPYVPPETEENNWWLIIILLLILIILVALAIIYRHKIQLWWLKRKGKTKSSKLPPGPMGGSPPPPGFRPGPPRFGPPPTRPMPMMQQRAMIRPSGAPLRSSSPNDKEMDETLKKLKKISEGK